MSIPDSGWFAVLQKIEIGWRVEASVASTVFVLTASILSLAYYDDGVLLKILLAYPYFLPFVVVVSVGLIFAFLLLYRWVDCLWKRLHDIRDKRVQRKLNELSDVQRELLNEVFQKGSRKFRFQTDIRMDSREYPIYEHTLSQQKQPDRIKVLRPTQLTHRQLEELIIYHYLECDIPHIASDYFSITENGWRELEKHKGKSA